MVRCSCSPAPRPGKTSCGFPAMRTASPSLTTSRATLPRIIPNTQGPKDNGRVPAAVGGLARAAGLQRRDRRRRRRLDVVLGERGGSVAVLCAGGDLPAHRRPVAAVPPSAKRWTASRSLGPPVLAQTMPMPSATTTTAPMPRYDARALGCARDGATVASPGRYWCARRIRSLRLTRIDWLIVAFTVVMATIGWRQGFVAGASRWRASSGVHFSGAALARSVARRATSPYAPLFALIGAVIAGSILAGLEGAGSGWRMRRGYPAWRTSTACWARCSARRSRSAWRGSSGPSCCRRPGVRQLRRDVQRSEILRRAQRRSSRRRARSSRRWRASIRSRTSTGRRPTCRRRARRSRATRGARGGRQRRAGPGHGVWLGVEGSGWVARRRTRRDQRARRRRGGGHGGAGARRRAEARRDGRWRSMRTNDVAVLRVVGAAAAGR